MTTPAGWYDDGSGQQRWWDGQQWTQHRVAPDLRGTPQLGTGQPTAKRRSRTRVWLAFLALPALLVGAAIVVLQRADGGGPVGVVTASELQAVTFDDPGGRPSDDWARSMQEWLSSGDDSECRVGSAHELAKGPRAEEFGSQLDVLYIYEGEDGRPPTAACDADIRGEDEDSRAFLVAVELFPDAETAVADWDASVAGANDGGEVLQTYRRSDPHPFVGGTMWISCWNDFDEPDERRNCNAHWFYDGVLLEGELSSNLDPEPTPQEAADWFAAVLPGITGAS